MSNGFEQLVTALQSRYDFQSARTMVREALSKAGLKEAPKYSKEELQRFVDGLATVGSHLDRVWGILGAAPSGTPVPAPVVEPAPAAAPAPEAAAEPAPAAPPADAAPAPEDKPVEEKPVEEKPAKKAKKDEAKGEEKKDDKGDEAKKD